MTHCLWLWLRASKTDQGQDLVEYALLLCLISTGLILILTALAGGVGDLFNSVRNILVPGEPLPA